MSKPKPEPINIVDFWKNQIAKWNEELKCGLCWEFSAPLTESAVGITKPNDPCCVQVMLVRDRVTAFRTSRTYDNITGLLTGVTCSKSFELLVLMPTKLGQNNYNEIKGHDTNESKWDEVLSKLEDCLSCDANLDFCEFLGRKVLVTDWSARQLVNYTDNNYTGYRLTVTFQVNVNS